MAGGAGHILTLDASRYLSCTAAVILTVESVTVTFIQLERAHLLLHIALIGACMI